MLKITVFLNEKAGGNAEKDSVLSNINKTFRDYGIEPCIVITSGNNLEGEIEKAVKDNTNIIAAVGGDGTVNLVALKVINTGIHLGVIPEGTLNHFAKDNNIPLNLDEAVKTICENYTIKIDTAKVNERYFLNNSSIGLYSHAVKERDKDRKRKKRGKYHAMFIASLSVLKRFRLYAIKINTDKDSKVISSPFVFVGNNEYKMDFFNLGSRDCLTSGKLSLFVVKTASRLGLLGVLLKIILNIFLPVKLFEMESLKEVIIESKRKNIPVSLDGEVIHLNPPLHYKIHPQSLNLIVPQKKN